MRDPSTVLSLTRDVDLADDMFMMYAETNNRIDVMSMSREECVVVLVWHATGIIGIGGFQHLFECDLPGDPGYLRVADSLCAIGAHQAHGALIEALNLFPNRFMPVDIPKR